VADSITVDMDLTALEQAITAMPVALRVRVNAACKTTAESAVREMKARLARQLSGQSSGQTVAGITSQPAYDGNGYVILSDNARMPNLPLWLEKGTRAGKRKNFARTAPRPFFYASLVLEQGGHERRLLDAMRDAATDSGLGE